MSLPCRRKQKVMQDELLQRVNMETLQALKRTQGDAPSGASGRKVSEINAYRSVNDIVPQHRDLQVQVMNPKT
jgi:nucleosome binding factor SPN SPT16 subunit